MITFLVTLPASRAGLAFVCIGLMLSTAPAALAQYSQQNTTATRPVDVIAAAELFGGLEPGQNEDGTTYAPASPADSDLGDQVILQSSSQYNPFSVSVQAQGNFTSNAALTDTGELDDFYLYSDLDLRYIPRITDTIFGNFSAQYGVYRYNNNISLDFNSLETTAGLMKVFPDYCDLVVWVNHNYTRLTEGHGDHDEFLADHSLELGLYRPFPIGDRHFAFASYVSSFSVGGDPEIARRDEHGLTFGYAFLPNEQLELSAYYQVFFYDYLRDGREDLLQDIGVGLEWNLGRGVSVGLQTSYAFNDSNTSDGDYAAGELGTSLTMTLQF